MSDKEKEVTIESEEEFLIPRIMDQLGNKRNSDDDSTKFENGLKFSQDLRIYSLKQVLEML